MCYNIFVDTPDGGDRPGDDHMPGRFQEKVLNFMKRSAIIRVLSLSLVSAMSVSFASACDKSSGGGVLPTTALRLR